MEGESIYNLKFERIKIWGTFVNVNVKTFEISLASSFIFSKNLIALCDDDLFKENKRKQTYPSPHKKTWLKGQNLSLVGISSILGN